MNKTYNKISKKHFFENFDDLNQDNGGHLGFLPIKKNAQSPQGASFAFLHHCSPNWYKMKKNSVYTLCQGQNTWPPDHYDCFIFFRPCKHRQYNNTTQTIKLFIEKLYSNSKSYNNNYYQTSNEST